MSHGRYKSPITATLSGIKDFFRKQQLEDRLRDSDRIDGKTCLVTGANRGLGFAIASELAQRGGRVIMACRSGIPEAGDIIKAATRSNTVEMLPVDLSDCESIHSLCRTLERRGAVIDILVLNAGITPPKSRQSKQGQDLMFMVNYLANFILVNRLLKTGVVPNNTFAGTVKTEQKIARIIFISSDSHQNASAIDYEEFGRYEPYGVTKAINNYSYFKLVLSTMATELSRLLAPEGKVDVSVNAVCPGPVNTDIIREAPLLLRVVLRFIFTLFFQPPVKAARPVVYLCVSPEVSGMTNLYMAMFNRKNMDPKVYDVAEGKKLWNESARVWKKIDPEAEGFLLTV
ncbi:MAG: SDR family NAD(P)-dependent oxidoreductase [Spirochaetales bacterium]|nr:SDR family NAD(P)-dependent oxidoreductase [Spirochaetales bacterium]